MIKKVIILIMFISSSIIYAQKREGYRLINLLNTYDSEALYIYNILNSKTDYIYLGTNKGVFKSDGYQLKKIKSLTGYIEFNSEDEIIGVERNTNEFYKTSIYNYLIESEDSLNNSKLSAISKSNLLFILYNGHLRVYERNIFRRILAGRSVRSISENYIGTYSGIFYKNEEFEELKSEILSDSYIREFNNNLYACYSALAVIDDDETIFFNNEKEETILFKRNLGVSKDIFAINGSFILFTSKGVYKTDLIKNLDIVVDSSEYTKELSRETFPKFVSYIQDKGYNDAIYLFANKTFYKYYIQNGDLEEVVEVGDALYLEQVDTELYYLNNDGLYLYTKKEGARLLMKNDNYHSFSTIGKSRIILASDKGLEIYDKSVGIKSRLITDEFNYGSIYKDERSFSIGTINGYFTAPLIDLINLPLREESKSSSDLIYIIILVFGSFLASFIALKAFYKRNEVIVVDSITSKKDDIEKYISKNLNSVTVNSIQADFNISYRQLSKLFNSPTLARHIENERKKIIHEGVKKNLSLEILSQETGYSISYLKKIISTL